MVCVERISTVHILQEAGLAMLCTHVYEVTNLLLSLFELANLAHCLLTQLCRVEKHGQSNS